MAREIYIIFYIILIKVNKKVIKVMNFHKMSIVPTEASQTSLGEAEPMSELWPNLVFEHLKESGVSG